MPTTTLTIVPPHFEIEVTHYDDPAEPSKILWRPSNLAAFSGTGSKLSPSGVTALQAQVDGASDGDANDSGVGWLAAPRARVGAYLDAVKGILADANSVSISQAHVTVGTGLGVSGSRPASGANSAGRTQR